MRAHLLRVDTQLARPAANARRVWTQRAALIVRLEDEAGRAGLGELAPLPGYSPDELDAGRAAIEAAPLARVSALGDNDALGWIAAVGALVPASLPAARHALETAALDLAARARGVPAWRLLRDAVRRTGARPDAIPLAALLDAERVLPDAEAAFARGIRTFKLKLGRDFERELASVAALRERFGAGVALRLDANQAWSPAEAGAHLAALARFEPELVEEPTNDLDALGGSPVPLARDESLQPPGARVDGPGVAAVVIKPMCVGGITRSLELAAAARALGLGVVLSHLFDGPIALAAAAALALAVASPVRAQGLDRFADGRAHLLASAGLGLDVAEPGADVAR